MDLLKPKPRNIHKRHGDEADCMDHIAEVSGFYGPGAVVSWFLLGASLLYDADKDPKCFRIKTLDYAKWSAFGLSGMIALGDAVVRAYRSGFGPSYAAALYISDKAFELATLFYCIKIFGIHRKPRDKQANSGDTEGQIFAKLKPKLPLFPCLAMVALWSWCRGLSNGHEVCNIRLQEPTISWRQVAPWYMKIVLSCVCFISTTAIGFYQSWDWFSWSLPLAILSSFAVLHSGLFGTLGAFRLITNKWNDQEQLAAVGGTLLALTIQYGTYWWKRRVSKAKDLEEKATEKAQELDRRRSSGASYLEGAIPAPEAVHPATVFQGLNDDTSG